MVATLFSQISQGDCLGGPNVALQWWLESLTVVRHHNGSHSHDQLSTSHNQGAVLSRIMKNWRWFSTKADYFTVDQNHSNFPDFPFKTRTIAILNHQLNDEPPVLNDFG